MKLPLNINKRFFIFFSVVFAVSLILFFLFNFIQYKKFNNPTIFGEIREAQSNALSDIEKNIGEVDRLHVELEELLAERKVIKKRDSIRYFISAEGVECIKIRNMDGYTIICNWDKL